MLYKQRKRKNKPFKKNKQSKNNKKILRYNKLRIAEYLIPLHKLRYLNADLFLIL